jgi:hypothetical protein
VNFESQVHFFNAWTEDQLKSLFGAQPPAASTVEQGEYVPPLSIDGTQTYQPPVNRRKRQTSNTPLPQCQNLPAYKNWAEEGKTAPVQHQLQCGKTPITVCD